MLRIAALVLLLSLPFQVGCLYYSCNQRDKFRTGPVEDQVRIVIDRHHTADVDAMTRFHFAGIPPFLVLNGMFGPRNCATFSSPDGEAVVTLRQAARFVQNWQNRNRLIQPALRGDLFPSPTREQLTENSPIRRNPQSSSGEVIPFTSVLVSVEPFVIAVVDVPKQMSITHFDDLRGSRVVFRSFDRDPEARLIESIHLPHTVTIGTELPIAGTVDFYIDERPRTVTTLNVPPEPGSFAVLHDARGTAILRLYREEALLRVRPAEPSDDET